MITLGVAAGPILVGLALLWVAERSGPGRARESNLVLALAPFSFLSLTIPLFLGASRFIAGFQQLAQEGKGGTQVVAPLCLSVVRPLLLGMIAALVGLLGIVVFQALFHRSVAPGASAEARTSSTWLGPLLLLVSSLLAVPVGVLLHVARNVASLTMLVVDPARKEEAKALLDGTKLAEVSGILASRLSGVFFGSLAMSAALLGAGIAGSLVARSTGRNRLLQVYSWLFLLGVALAAAWGIVQLQSDISWYKAAAAGPP